MHINMSRFNKESPKHKEFANLTKFIQIVFDRNII